MDETERPPASTSISMPFVPVGDSTATSALSESEGSEDEDDYERQRLKNIEENNKLLLSLGLLGGSGFMAPGIAVAAEKKPEKARKAGPKRVKRDPPPLREPSRRSCRVAGIQAMVSFFRALECSARTRRTPTHSSLSLSLLPLPPRLLPQIPTGGIPSRSRGRGERFGGGGGGGGRGHAGDWYRIPIHLIGILVSPHSPISF